MPALTPISWAGPDQEVEIVPYDPAWPGRFEAESSQLEPLLRPWLTGGLHHVGSTSVPGLGAKPIVDIMAGVRSLAEAEPIAVLEANGWCHWPYGWAHWFCKPSPEQRLFHLLLVEPSHPQWRARLAFRDYLRSHSDVSAEYQRLKCELAERHRKDREAYGQAKTAFVERVTALALGQQ